MQTIANPFEAILSELAEIKEKVSAPTPTAEPVEIIDRQELQRRLGITEPTVMRYGKKGTIPELRIGANVRYNWPEVVAALSNRKTSKS